jgi:acyl-CoA synthetase (AMP-forming)/AMP-acid ligase II
VLFHRVTGHEKRLPLGKPIDNVILKIIDIDTGEPIQQGTGLLHIGGAAVAKGYTNVNSDNFYSEIVQGDKIRFYNSGDVVRIDDGDIYFKGRLDNQIKIGGVRIELEEIERTVSALYGVDDCVAIFDKGIQCFCSGLMPLSTEEMKHELTRALPAVFIPKKISKVDSIKLLSNGKVDRMHYEQMC